MATVNHKSNFIEHGVLRTEWNPLTSTDTVGTPENLDRFPTHSIQISGTFGGATVVVEGSEDDIDYFTLTGENPAGGADTLVSATSPNRFDLPNVVPHFIRPRIASGAGITTAVKVIINSKSYGN